MSSWREGSGRQRALVTAWLEARTKLTHRSDPVPEPFRTRPSCGCGHCPTFEVLGLILDPAEDGWPAKVEGDAASADGSKPCGILVFAHESDTEFEIYPYGDDAVTLEDLAEVSFHLV